MKISVYVVVTPRADRPYVATFYPEDLARTGGTRVYRADLDLPDAGPVDGVVEAVAERVELEP